MKKWMGLCAFAVGLAMVVSSFSPAVTAPVMAKPLACHAGDLNVTPGECVAPGGSRNVTITGLFNAQDSYRGTVLVDGAVVFGPQEYSGPDADRPFPPITIALGPGGHTAEALLEVRGSGGKWVYADKKQTTFNVAECPVPPTDTPVPTETPVPPTDTPVPSDTPMPSDTPVPSNTPTETPTDTTVPSNTPTATFTVTNTVEVPSETPTFTLTATVTNTPDISVTPSSTATVTNTPDISVTPSDTATITPTATSTGTVTNTPVISFTPSSTSTVTLTATNTNTPTVTNTAVNTNTPIPTNTPYVCTSACVTATPTNTPHVCTSACITATLTATPYVCTVVVTPVATATPVEPKTGSGTAEQPGGLFFPGLGMIVFGMVMFKFGK